MTFLTKRFLITFLCFGCASVFAIPTIHHWKNKQGVGVYFVRATDVPMVDVRVIFTAGSAYDGKQWGLANITNTMLSKGTKSRSAEQISESLDTLGALFSESISRDMATVSLRSLVASHTLQESVSLFHDILSHPSFSNKEFSLLQSKLRMSYQFRHQNPDSIAALHMFQSLYPNHPYGHPITGDKASLAALHASDCQRFYRRFYVQHNAKIVVVGDLTIKQVKSMTASLLSDLPKGLSAPALPMAPIMLKQRQERVNFPSQQSAIYLSQLGITRKNPDYYALMLVNHILGQAPMTSILFDEVRNKRGLSYSIYSYFQPLRFRGPFVVGLKTKSTSAEAAIKQVHRVLADFRQAGPTSSQLALAKSYYQGSFPRSYATNASLLGVVTNIAFYQRKLDFLQNFIANINKVTVAQARRAFIKMVHPTKMLLVVVGPKEKQEEQVNEQT